MLDCLFGCCFCVHLCGRPDLNCSSIRHSSGSQLLMYKQAERLKSVILLGRNEIWCDVTQSWLKQHLWFERHEAFWSTCPDPLKQALLLHARQSCRGWEVYRSTRARPRFLLSRWFKSRSLESTFYALEKERKGKKTNSQVCRRAQAHKNT